MKGYLGETIVDQSETPYKDYGVVEWAIHFSGLICYDGAHHKDYAMDQVVRVLHGCPITIKLARWDNGEQEYRTSVGENEAYRKYVKDYEEGGKYEYPRGIAP